jgi:hypothetical protein
MEAKLKKSMCGVVGCWLRSVSNDVVQIATLSGGECA